MFSSRCGGRGRGHHVDGSGPSQLNEPEPQPKQHHMKEEVEVANADYDEQPREEVKPHPLDDYPSDLHDLYVLIMYHVHVAIRMSGW